MALLPTHCPPTPAGGRWRQGRSPGGGAPGPDCRRRGRQHRRQAASQQQTQQGRRRRHRRCRRRRRAAAGREWRRVGGGARGGAVRRRLCLRPARASRQPKPRPGAQSSPGCHNRFGPRPGLGRVSQDAISRRAWEALCTCLHQPEPAAASVGGAAACIYKLPARSARVLHRWKRAPRGRAGAGPRGVDSKQQGDQDATGRGGRHRVEGQ
jgi:hypothetical protein